MSQWKVLNIATLKLWAQVKSCYKSVMEGGREGRVIILILLTHAYKNVVGIIYHSEQLDPILDLAQYGDA